MTDTIDSIHQRFVEHRKRQRLGPYPRVLREQALRELSEAQQLELAARLKLPPAQMRRWRELHGGQHPVLKPTMCTDAFHEVRLPQASAAVLPHPPKPDIEVAIELAAGARMRVKGQLDAELVRALITALHDTARKS